MKRLLSCAALLATIIAASPIGALAETPASSADTVSTHRRLTLGGYGEAVASRMFYSNNYKRYTDASLYADAPSFGQVDLPHVVFYVGYDFGHGWSMGSEIEFEHGGTESAVEIEEEETGEYEKEIERGGEVALEQFWLQKSFSPALNIRAGHIIVPVGGTNAAHEPDKFFTVYRPEGENTILPCTWHETGVSLWGRSGDWRYEGMVIAGLDGDRFNNKNWIHGGAGSPYEFKMATAIAGAARIDNYSVDGLRLSLSGYVGNSGCNTLNSSGKYEDLKATVTIAAFDFMYDNHNIVARGNFDYGFLSNSLELSVANKASRKDSPSPKNNVAKNAIAMGIEAGYDLASFMPRLHSRGQRLYLFGRYDYYDSMYRTVENMTKEEEWGRQRITFGFNYFPIKQIVVKGEWSNRIFKSQFNNEPTLSLGVGYYGLFQM